MKRLGALVCLLLFAMSSIAWGVSLCDYRSPVTALTDARMSFAYRYYNDAATPEIDVNSGRLGVDYDQLFDSPNYGFTLGGSVELTGGALLRIRRARGVVGDGPAAAWSRRSRWGWPGTFLGRDATGKGRLDRG